MGKKKKFEIRFHFDAHIGTKKDLINHYINQLYVDDLYLEVF